MPRSFEQTTRYYTARVGVLNDEVEHVDQSFDHGQTKIPTIAYEVATLIELTYVPQGLLGPFP